MRKPEQRLSGSMKPNRALQRQLQSVGTAEFVASWGAASSATANQKPIQMQLQRHPARAGRYKFNRNVKGTVNRNVPGARCD
jgi:hypothetical protein